EVGRLADFAGEAGEFRAVEARLHEDGGNRPDEDAGIPREVPALEVLFGEVGVGFFAEFDTLEYRGDIGARAGDDGAAAAFDVAVARAGPGGFDAARDEGARVTGDLNGCGQAFLEGGAVLNQLVGRNDDHGGVGIAGG